MVKARLYRVPSIPEPLSCKELLPGCNANLPYYWPTFRQNQLYSPQACRDLLPGVRLPILWDSDRCHNLAPLIFAALSNDWAVVANRCKCPPPQVFFLESQKWHGPFHDACGPGKVTQTECQARRPWNNQEVELRDNREYQNQGSHEWNGYNERQSRRWFSNYDESGA